MAKNAGQIRFEGEPLVVSPRFAQLKNDKFGRTVIASVNEKYAGTPAEIPREDIQAKNQPIVGSNSYRLFAIDTVARQFGARIARPEEQELLLVQNRLPEQGTVNYDRGVILDLSGANHDLALKLYDSLPNELKDLDRLPAVMLALELSKNGDALEFVYGANSQLRTSKILNSETRNFRADDPELLRTGLPSAVGDGTRTLYTTTQRTQALENNLGLRGFSLSGGSNLYADVDALAVSSDDGRVVLCADEVGGVKNLDDYVTAVEQVRTKAVEQAARIRDEAVSKLSALR